MSNDNTTDPAQSWPDRLLTAKEVAAILRRVLPTVQVAGFTRTISRTELYTLAVQGHIQAIRLGRRCIRFQLSAINEFIVAHGGQPVTWDSINNGEHT